MRNDYFTFTEMEHILGAYNRKLHELAERENLPMIPVGNRRYVIPKRRFFEWYDAQKASNMHLRFRADRVQRERNIWMDKMTAMRYGGKYSD